MVRGRMIPIDFHGHVPIKKMLCIFPDEYLCILRETYNPGFYILLAQGISAYFLHIWNFSYHACK